MGVLSIVPALYSYRDSIMQVIYHTGNYNILSSIFGVVLEHKHANKKRMLVNKQAEAFMSFYRENLSIIPPRAINAAIDDLCDSYFPNLQTA